MPKLEIMINSNPSYKPELKPYVLKSDTVDDIYDYRCPTCGSDIKVGENDCPICGEVFE
jgi:rubrerythrin